MDSTLRRGARKRTRTAKAGGNDPLDRTSKTEAKKPAKRRRAKTKSSSPATASPNTSSTTTAIAAPVPTTNGPELSARRQADVQKSVAVATREAKAAAKRAQTEQADRTKCFAKEDAVMTDHAPTTNLTTPHAAPIVRAAAEPINPGDYVRVTPDRSPHHNCPGGEGWVVSVRGKGAALTADVHWTAYKGGSKDVPLTRLVVVQPFAKAPVRACRREAAAAEQAAAIKPQPLLSAAPIHERLLSAKVRGLRKGWRCREICGKGVGRLSYEQKLLAGADVRELWAFLDGVKAGGGRSTARLTLSKPEVLTKKGRIVLVERDEPWEGRKPLTKQFLHWSWGIGRGPLDKYAKARQAL